MRGWWRGIGSSEGDAQSQKAAQDVVVGVTDAFGRIAERDGGNASEQCSKGEKGFRPGELSAHAKMWAQPEGKMPIFLVIDTELLGFGKYLWIAVRGADQALNYGSFGDGHSDDFGGS